ncbi:hypothetical protein [Bradyrhizobium yuanmingense]|uniref:hypothetical protein n=1 Tax=Bradyrhizobium yuanmingense TaxID=108015 RepID=UPI0023B9CA12|nr:hypothetical protein [Bradyrhizobium yuanmingense]MDF0585065.1 hypothetical protein [Bradyrhizobium yuanmingense]
MPDEHESRIVSNRDLTDQDLSRAIVEYQKNDSAEWQAYLQSETQRGFITNGMNDQIKAHLERLFPGLAWKGYSEGAVRFRFACERMFHFVMWQPQNRARRWEGYWAYVREVGPQQRGVRSNGVVYWSKDEVLLLLSVLQEKQPEFWSKLCGLYNDFGFADTGAEAQFGREVAGVFAVPEDVDYVSQAMRLVMSEANRLYGFEMLKPENDQTRYLLWKEWDSNPGQLPFEEWCREVRARRAQSKRTKS